MPVEGKDGCLVCRRLVGPRRNLVAEEFALRIQKDSGCLIADREHDRDVEPGQLKRQIMAVCLKRIQWGDGGIHFRLFPFTRDRHAESPELILLAERERERLERLPTDPASFTAGELEVHKQASWLRPGSCRLRAPGHERSTPPPIPWGDDRRR